MALDLASLLAALDAEVRDVTAAELPALALQLSALQVAAGDPLAVIVAGLVGTTLPAPEEVHDE